jgi:titin
VLVSNYGVIQGNYIGTGLTGAEAAGNGADGIAIYGGAHGNLVGAGGDNDTAERNIISANVFSGVSISGAGTNDNVVAGNFVGTDVTGTASLGNGANGVSIFAGAQDNRIGSIGTHTDAARERNVISANHWSGIGISDTGTNHNLVAGNIIGLDATGAAALGNLNLGVGISNGAQFNEIGTGNDHVGAASERNIISSNAWQGVRIGDPGTDLNTVAGNYIGTDKTGTVARGNHLDGVLVYNGAASNQIGSNLDGDNDAAEANLISGNLGGGVIIEDSGSDQNRVQDNLIGTDAKGIHVLGNDGVGVGVNGAARENRIRRNTIYGNGGLGIGLGGNNVAINQVGTRLPIRHPMAITTALPLMPRADCSTATMAASSAWTIRSPATSSGPI